MAVELEEIALLGLFTLDGKTIQIRADQFMNIGALLPELQPIAIEAQKLQRLGFLRYPSGIYYRKYGTCEFLLRPLKEGRWEFVLEGGQRIRIVSHPINR